MSAKVSNATTIGKGATSIAVIGGATGQNTHQQDGLPDTDANDSQGGGFGQILRTSVNPRVIQLALKYT